MGKRRKILILFLLMLIPLSLISATLSSEEVLLCPTWQFDRSREIRISGCPIINDQQMVFLTREAKSLGASLRVEGKTLILSANKKFIRVTPLNREWVIDGKKQIEDSCAPVFYNDRLVMSIICAEKLFSHLFGAPVEIPSTLKNRPIVVLDPGHGGSDPGAAVNRLKEKDIALELGWRLKTEFEKLGKVTPILTRKSDEFLSLETRSLIANRVRASAFVSLHCNSNPNRRLAGAETYILEDDRLDSPARRLAVVENSLVYLPSIKSESTTVQEIIKNLEQQKFLKDSENLAKLIQEKFSLEGLSLHRGIYKAPFAVLQRAAMPAVLVEIGYLTNMTDSYKLSNSQYLSAMARSLAFSISKFVLPEQVNLGNK